jgi:hypothetical protein
MFPWHSVQDQTMQIHLCKPSSYLSCFDNILMDTTLAGANVQMPQLHSEGGKTPLVATDTNVSLDGKVPGCSIRLAFQLRRIPLAVLRKQFDAELLDPASYVHEQDYCFPHYMPQLSQLEPFCNGDLVVGRPLREQDTKGTPTDGDGHEIPFLLGRQALPQHGQGKPYKRAVAAAAGEGLVD